jgi:hypothetical protein
VILRQSSGACSADGTGQVGCDAMGWRLGTSPWRVVARLVGVVGVPTVIQLFVKWKR